MAIEKLKIRRKRNADQATNGSDRFRSKPARIFSDICGNSSGPIAKQVSNEDTASDPEFHWYGIVVRRASPRPKDGQWKKFDFHQLTAASWTLPLGTDIRVINLENGKSVVVTISDRGPNQRLHRIVDLSKAAAEQLSYVDRGLTAVFLSPATHFEMQEAEYDSRLVEPPI